MATNALNWFEIPATDLGRATTFYETAMATKLEPVEMGDMKMAFFPADEDGVGGGLIQHPQATPSTQGSRIYLNANPDLQNVLDRIPAAGGQVVMPKTQITPEIGYMAMFMDTEGNVVALHSNG